MCTSGSQNTSSACPPRHEQTQSEASSWHLAWFWILHSADTSPGFLSHLWNGEYIAVCQHWTESLYLCLQGIHSPGFQKSLMIPHHPKENTTSNPPRFRFQTCQLYANYNTSVPLEKFCQGWQDLHTHWKNHNKSPFHIPTISHHRPSSTRPTV